MVITIENKKSEKKWKHVKLVETMYFIVEWEVIKKNYFKNMVAPEKKYK